VPAAGVEVDEIDGGRPGQVHGRTVRRGRDRGVTPSRAGRCALGAGRGELGLRKVCRTCCADLPSASLH